MSKRIVATTIAIVIVTLLLTGTGTFVLARVATTNDDLGRLETKAGRTNDLLVALDEGLLRTGGAAARANGPLARATKLRRQLIDALSVSGSRSSRWSRCPGRS